MQPLMPETEQTDQPEQSEVDSQPQMPIPDGWVERLQWLINNPNREALAAVITAPHYDPREAYMWVFLGGAIYGIPLLFNAFSADILTVLAISFSVVGIATTVGFIGQNWIFQRIAMIYGGTAGSYGRVHAGRGILYPVVLVLQGLATIVLLMNDTIGSVVLTVVIMIDLLLTTFVVQQVNGFKWAKSMLMVGTTYFAIIIFNSIFIGA
ncbi:MAG: hypothetical protein AAFN11_23010 [Chloroflexota bacterium]